MRIRKYGIAVLTLAWLAWELWAAFDTSQDTWPLTQIVVTYVPAWIYLPAAAVLAVWLPWHFWVNYQRRHWAQTRNPKDTIMTVPNLPTTDAMSRAVRTFVQGLAVDVVAAVLAVLATLLTDVHPTKAWALAAVGLLVKTAASAAASYAHNKLSPVTPAGQ